MHHPEAGKIEEIVEIEIVGMGKTMKRILHKRMKKKLSRMLRKMKLKEKNVHHHHQHWQK